MQIRSVAICGVGTMGSGIAQAIAVCGYTTILFDINSAVLEKARQSIQKQLNVMVEKGKISFEQKEKAFAGIRFTNDINECRSDLVIEAVAEVMEIKTQLFRTLTSINSTETIFASNTSSLSVTSIAGATNMPERFCGLHFFNPAPVMKLVEVVRTEKTKPEIIEQAVSFIIDIKKTPVVCKDAPGFIVNRVARHFYLESLKLVEDQSVSMSRLDALMESSGFKMGPFKLMDFIGNDVNLAVTISLYNSFDQAIRFKPSALQIEKVEKGELGKKTGKGYYDYGN
ncbi:3-hydroxyacyl-CoA dehydrogenase family protein [Pollutibacter soli]|uniref:3-hydroxyacyl-CoA dehydrogenase family protein n=1 Tax=Pollutibacter soli TaxID=3034157 RepID=UPI00301396CE